MIHTKNRSPQKGLLSLLIKQWAKDNKKELKFEYRFHTKRLWRADFALVDLKILIEYEGLVSAKSRHTTLKGFSADCEKYNNAQILGFRVLRYTAFNYGKVTNDLQALNEPYMQE